MNQGKRFELDFKSSIPDDVFYYRFRDLPTAWAKDTQSLKFTLHNIADCELYYHGNLYILELKSTQEKSIPFGNFFKEDKTDIVNGVETIIKGNRKRIDDMLKAAEITGITCGFVVNFRFYPKTFFMPVKFFDEYYKFTDSSSIPISIFKKHCSIIEHEKKRIHYRYNIKKFINDNCTYRI